MIGQLPTHSIYQNTTELADTRVLLPFLIHLYVLYKPVLIHPCLCIKTINLFSPRLGVASIPTPAKSLCSAGRPGRGMDAPFGYRICGLWIPLVSASVKG